MSGRNEQPGRRQLDHPLAALQPSARARKTCEKLGVLTVAHFVLTPRQSFLDVPGCGERTYAELENKVLAWLARSFGDEHSDLDLTRPLRPLVAGQPVERELETLDLQTVGDFLALPRELAVKALGRRSWQQVLAAIERTRRLTPSAVPLLPGPVRQVSLGRIGLPADLLPRFEELGCTTVGHAFTLPAGLFEEGRELGPAAALAVRTALDQVFRPALELLEAADPTSQVDWPTLRGRLLAPLEPDEREWLCQRTGLGARGRAAPPHRPTDGSRGRDEAVRARLEERSPSLLRRLHQEILRELEAGEGLVRADRLAVGTLLHVAARGSGDPGLPLRLAAFCWPDELHVHAGCLTALPGRSWHRLVHRVRALTGPQKLPRPLEELRQHLRASVDPVPRGLLVHVLTEICHLRVQIDAERGELVLPQQRAPGARLAALLLEEGRPTPLEDLVFHYRERYRSARRYRLLLHLRRDPQFLEIGRGIWSLRTWHEDEVEAARRRAEEVVERACQRGGKQPAAELLGEACERTLHLVLDLVRRDGRLRYLGRGEVCPSRHSRSQVLHELLRDFRKAMGEVPMSRFVQNHPPERRRLVQRLLIENRLFVFPAPDRIDVLTNYPFNAERLQRLVEVVDTFLGARNGYAPLSTVLEEVNRCDLGGGWLTPTLLGELLRRHGPFEVLPGDFVARSVLGLGAWLMRRARNALREAAVPISLEELLVERPELSEFAGCLGELLHRDPLVQTPDGLRFQIA